VGRSADGLTPYYDYDGDAGDTIRFGDGTFGNLPLPGTIFDVTYRVAAGGDGNVAAGSITQLDPAAAAAGVTAATNPLPAAGGADAQALASIARLAPEEFQAVQYRAVRPEDYQAAAQTLPWVLRANTTFRWTGSWLTVFTTVDPLESEQITSDEQTILINLLNRYRMAGYESYVPEAQYVSLDLVIDVCALSSAFNANVETAVLAVLNPQGSANGTAGFFNHANFTFGQSLERSDLEAAIQGATGVAGVMCVRYRVRNRTAALAEMPDVVTVAPDEIIRCDNDPNFPEHGSLNITVNGGK
jgi:predicted phage baseplate assembly protein